MVQTFVFFQLLAVTAITPVISLPLPADSNFLSEKEWCVYVRSMITFDFVTYIHNIGMKVCLGAISE